MNQTDLKIKEQIEVILEKLNANVEILSVVGSWGDTLEDDEILKMLISINNDKSIFPDVNLN